MRSSCGQLPDGARRNWHTNELLRADQFYGVRQYWGTEADFGFSKTQEESFRQVGMSAFSMTRAVLAIRRERPLCPGSNIRRRRGPTATVSTSFGEIEQEKPTKRRAIPASFPSSLHWE